MFNDKALKTIREYLLNTNETIAVAESVTSGFLQAAISTAVDATNFFQGGITAYNLGQKFKHLHVNPIHAEACNCVSDEVASDMALNVCTNFKSHWGLSLTGFATKVKEGNYELYAHYGIAYNSKLIAVGIIHSNTKAGVETQLYFVNELLNKFTAYIKRKTAKKKN